MTVTAEVLFDRPQREIASLILDRMSRSSATSIVTGFATPGGLAAISGPIRRQPRSLATLVVGAATYPAFEALDELIDAGVNPDNLRVHLGHTAPTGGRKNPFARYHPMLHSKIYYMELTGGACAFIGSHNLTSFALTGLNGEAAILLEGPLSSPEFEAVRQHVAAARGQAVKYTPSMKEAYTWWTREFLEGLRLEMGLHDDWKTVRTILIFAQAPKGTVLAGGDQLYFELPAGIAQIDSLNSETHLFLFDILPTDPWQALAKAGSALAAYSCRTLGAENKQGNLEVTANWAIQGTATPMLQPVPTGTLRLATPGGMQQVRAEVEGPQQTEFEYRFERERFGWDPELSATEQLGLPEAANDRVAVAEAQGGRKGSSGWRLVTGLQRREGAASEGDAYALQLAAPESGSFILVSLRRRKKDKVAHDETRL